MKCQLQHWVFKNPLFLKERNFKKSWIPLYNVKLLNHSFNIGLSSQYAILTKLFQKYDQCKYFIERTNWAAVWDKIGSFSSGILLVLGIAGNILAILVLSKDTSNISFNRLLISLAVVDILLIVDMVVQKSIIGNFVKEEPLWYKLSYPFVWHPVKGMIQSAAIFMVVAVSAERYR